MPLFLSDYPEIDRNREFEGSKFWSPTPEIVGLCDDKLALNRRLIDSPFQYLVPPLYEPDSGRFPYIVKRRHDTWGVNSRLVTNSAQEQAVAALTHSPAYFCQSYIAGNEEFALHVLLVDRQVVYAQTVKYQMDRYFYVKGCYLEENKRVLLVDNPHISTYEPVLRALGYSGTCCINYKLEDGVPKLLEINPRFGGSLVDDINRYLEAYVGSLLLQQRSGAVPPLA